MCKHFRCCGCSSGISQILGKGIAGNNLILLKRLCATHIAWPKIKRNVRHLVNPYGFVILKRHDEIAVMRFPSRVVHGFPTNLWKPLKVDVEYVTPGIVYMVPWQTNDKVAQDSSRPFQLSSKRSQNRIQFVLFWCVKLFSCNRFEVHIGSTCNGGTVDKLQAFDPRIQFCRGVIRFVFFGNLGNFHDLAPCGAFLWTWGNHCLSKKHPTLLPLYFPFTESHAIFEFI